jgi:hypothetical protein
MNKSAPFKLASSGLVALAMTGVVLHLPGCGGGGSSEGAPFNPAPSPSSPTTLRVNPGAVDVYLNAPVALLISGGLPPYRAFSSSPSVLPISQDVVGSTITLVPNNVTDTIPVTVTITDASGQSTTASVNVKSATLVGDLVVTPGSSSPGSGCAPAVCSGQTATAEISLKTPTGTPIVGRQVRFEALQGQFNFTLDDAASQVAKTIVVTTDVAGKALVRLRADTGAATAFALIRATDLVTGNRLDKAFNIAQFTDGTGTLSVTPKEYGHKGFYKGECGGSTGDFLVFGGTPPYTIKTALPTGVDLSAGGLLRQAQVSVDRNGGRFTAQTRYVTQGCTGYEAVITVTDATGRTVNVTYKEEEGSEPVPTPAPPADLVISPQQGIILPTIDVQTITGTPPNLIFTTTKYCSGIGAQDFILAGGTGPFTLSVTPSDFVSASGAGVIAFPAPNLKTYGVNGRTFVISYALPADQPSGKVLATVTIVDTFNSKQKVATINCQ